MPSFLFQYKKKVNIVIGLPIECESFSTWLNIKINELINSLHLWKINQKVIKNKLIEKEKASISLKQYSHFVLILLKFISTLGIQFVCMFERDIRNMILVSFLCASWWLKQTSLIFFVISFHFPPFSKRKNCISYLPCG